MKKFPVLLVVVAFALGAGGTWYVLQPRPSPAIDLADLRAQLDQAAARTLPLPELGVETISVSTASASFDAWEEKIILATRQLGATSRRGLDRENARVYLVTLRPVALPALRAALFSLEAPIVIPTEATAEADTIDCEVVLRPIEP